MSQLKKHDYLICLNGEPVIVIKNAIIVGNFETGKMEIMNTADRKPITIEFTLSNITPVTLKIENEKG